MRQKFIVVLATFILVCSAAQAGPPKSPNSTRLSEIMQKASPYAEASFFTCLLNGLQQGLPLAQAQTDCEAKLALDYEKGFGSSFELGPFAHGDRYFDPTSVTADCTSGDPGISGGAMDKYNGVMGWLNPRNERVIIMDKEAGSFGRLEHDYGSYSWGGTEKCTGNTCTGGLTKEESGALKMQAVDEAERLRKVWLSKVAESVKDPTNAAKKKETDDAYKAYEEALKKAKEDPNTTVRTKPSAPGDYPTPDDDTAIALTAAESECAQALQEAREILGECHRTGWKNGGCQSLWAQLHGCADPTLIYVDPDSGYACGTPVDAEGLKNALIEKCQELKRPVPSGPDPCVPPDVDQLGRFVQTDPSTLCGDPAARIDPDSEECFGTVTVQSFAPDLQKMLVWGLNKFGGPIVVLPDPRNDGPPPDGPLPK
jgi:hypothetical protein